MDRMERHRIVAAYVRKRVQEECEARGRRIRIAEKTGFTAGYVSHILTGFREVGPEFARRMAELWGMSFEELEKAAFEAQNLPIPQTPVVQRDLPNLRDTIEWCHQGKVYPYRFLRKFEREAEIAGVERSRREWLTALEEAYKAFEKENATPKPRSSGRKISSEEASSGFHLKQGATESPAPAHAQGTARRRGVK